ncbi:hypothetical protein DICPUDRAFT_156077 [Dictyostelium purpureum]|uniref:rRNA adenine N(6)-methyltransferase n=1 Tax=Dictyostelium purpureum TaxID=5786 RepID=F0ZVM9_DICPU|nr:uncharacterized protein DICPUDRAFT_156077 [Dictyostelium purpureum]EGC32018.1 hypothetical protein DICPUDRAFT_156077 [Dictyostelium purpureum]|eukprot:XP_003291474.1 hypothetical protein DICPUDRAFT_156077 [Dictyostelium purpureum]
MSNKLPPMPTLQEIIRTFGLSAKQQLSQNFLIDKNITDKICKTSGGFKDCTVIEVGAGPGGLTRSLLTSEAKKVIAVEMDPRFYPALKMLEDASEGRMKLIMANMLEVDEAKILFENGAEFAPWEEKSKVKIIGNLPFNVGTHLMLKWIRQISPREGLYSFGRVPIGTADYSRLSVMVQQSAIPRITYQLPGKAFVPPPKVDAAVVEIEPRINPLGKEPLKNHQYFEFVCRELFAHRRKTVSNVIKNLGNGADALLEGIIDPKTRPQNISVDQFVDLTNRYCDFPNKKEIDIFEFLNEGKSLRKEKKLEEKATELKDRIERTKKRQEFRLQKINERKEKIELLKQQQQLEEQLKEQDKQEEEEERDENDIISKENAKPPKEKKPRLTQEEIDLEDLQIEEEIDKDIKQKDIRDLDNYQEQLEELLHKKEKNESSKQMKKEHLDIIDQYGNVVLHGKNKEFNDTKNIKEDFDNIDEDEDYENFLNEQLKK